MDLANQACDLECTQGKNVHEFVGPVKIIFVDPPKGAYSNKAKSSAFVALANLFMGATTMTVLFYALDFKYEFPINVHLFLCTVGYQLFIPSGILMLNLNNGASAHLKECDRNMEHLILEICGVIFALGGTAIVVILSKFPLVAMNNAHCITGICAGVFIILSSVSGFLTYAVGNNGLFGKIFKFGHMYFGVPGFLVSSWCFISGILKPSFILQPQDITHFLTFFCVFYSLIVVFKSLKSFVGCSSA